MGNHPTSRYEGKVMSKEIEDKRNPYYKRTSKFLKRQANKKLRQDKNYLETTDE